MSNKHLLEESEKKGLVADSLEVRRLLIKQVHEGKISFSDAQDEIKKIKRTAHSLGLYKREDFYKSNLVSLEKINQENKKKLNFHLKSELDEKELTPKNKL